MRIGIGYDMHALAPGRAMVLGGVNMPCEKGPEGHSDGDALLHAVCDAILGAMAQEDIGVRFPDTDPEYKDISSIKLLENVKSLMDSEGFKVNNLDCVVVTEKPKISPYREEMVRVISGALGAPRGAVNIKGKTAEQLGVIGENKAVAAYAVVLLEEGV